MIEAVKMFFRGLQKFRNYSEAQGRRKQISFGGAHRNKSQIG